MSNGTPREVFEAPRGAPGILALAELKIVRALAAGKTQAEIGAELHLEQSTISKIIKNAEDRIGFALAESTGRRNTLTAAGRELAGAADRVISAFEAFDGFARELRRGDAGTVRFAASSTPGSYVLPRIVAHFLREHPRVSVDMRIMPISGLWQTFETEEFDFAIAPVMGLPKGLKSEPLYDDPVVFFATPGAPIAAAETVTLRDLAGETLIGKFVDSHWRRIFRELEESGFHAKRTFTLIPPEGVKRMVSQGLGIGVLFESSIRAELESGTLVRIPVAIAPLYDRFCIAMSAQAVASPATENFLADLRVRMRHEWAEYVVT